MFWQPSGALDSPQDVARYPAAAPLGWVRGRVWPCGEDVLSAWEEIACLRSGFGPPVTGTTSPLLSDKYPDMLSS